MTYQPVADEERTLLAGWEEFGGSHFHRRDGDLNLYVIKIIYSGEWTAYAELERDPDLVACAADVRGLTLEEALAHAADAGQRLRRWCSGDPEGGER
jgi:hypothetical protein